MLLAKKCQFFLYLHLVKIRLEILLSDLADKKETYFTLKKKKEFFKVQIIVFFSKGLIKNAKFLFI